MSVLIGLVFCAYLLYNKYGKLGQLEFISLGITAVIAFGVSFIMIKKGNKK